MGYISKLLFLMLLSQLVILGCLGCSAKIDGIHITGAELHFLDGYDLAQTLSKGEQDEKTN